MSETKELLQRAREEFTPPADFMGSLNARRERKRRRQRVSAAVVAIVIAFVSLAALTGAFRGAGPASEPKPPGIFSEVGGWITYGDADGIWAVDPSHPRDLESRVQLSSNGGIPLSWSSDGSELLIARGWWLLSPRQLRDGEKVPASRRGLFLLHADGTEIHLVRDEVSGASLSPDGTTVVFAPASESLPKFDPGIYRIDADGGVATQLLASSSRYIPEQDRSFRTEVYFPTFSPDGTQIAYFDGFGDNSHSLRVVNADGGDLRVLIDKIEGYRISNLVWSPDGTRLAFGRIPDGVYTIGADGSGLTLVIPGGAYPQWSPDGSRISYQQQNYSSPIGNLLIANADGTQAGEIYGQGSGGPWNPLVQPQPEVRGGGPASEPRPKPPGIFSEVGGWIAYAWSLTDKCEPSPCVTEVEGIWAVDPTRPDDPNSQIQLTTEMGTPLAWSSDGSKLLILRRNTTPRPPHQAFDGGNLFVLNADGTETRLTEGDAWITGGSFSPDGSKVVYATWGNSPQRILAVETAGGTPHVLVTGGLLDAPTFSPDGSKIAYFGGERLRVMNADGSGSRVLTHDVFGAEGYARDLVWSPDATRLAIDFGGDIYTIGADGSDLTLVIPHGGNPNWSPDGSRIAYDFEDVSHPPGPHLEIADADGKNTQEFGTAGSGPWNPLVQPEPEVAEAPAASGGLTPTSLLLPLAGLMILALGVFVIRRRTGHETGKAV